MELFLRKNEIQFISYDKIRRDKFKKHAPVDNIIVVLEDSEKDIEEICCKNRNQSKFSVKELEELKTCGGLGIEVKSTRISDRHIQYKTDLQKFASTLRKNEHFLMYPSYCRCISDIFETEQKRIEQFKKNNNIFSQEFLHQEYISRFFQGDEEKFRKHEYLRMLPIIARAYVDSKDFSVLLVSWIKSKDFCSSMRIAPLAKNNKSENALYNIVNLSSGRSFHDFASEIEKMKIYMKKQKENNAANDVVTTVQR